MPLSNPQLQNFIAALAVDRGCLGLVVTASEVAALALPFPKGKIGHATVGSDADPEDAITALLGAAQDTRWCRLDLVDGNLPGRVYNQLRMLATSGHLQIVNPAIEVGMTDVRWPVEAKIVVVISQASLDAMTVPAFLDLFGPILREA
jgi:hypothetical protein